MSNLDPNHVTVEPVILNTKSALVAAVALGVERALTRARTAWEKERVDAPGFGYVENEEAMRLLNLSRPTLARYRKNGRLPYSRVGSKVYYKLSAIEALLERHAVGGDSADTNIPITG